MVPTGNSTHEITAVQALESGAAYLVDEHGQHLPGTPEQQLQTGRCWAHLRDGSTGQWYVQELRQACELDTPRLLAMLLPFPEALENEPTV